MAKLLFEAETVTKINTFSLGVGCHVCPLSRNCTEDWPFMK